LKLYRHEASRGLFVTAELLVMHLKVRKWLISPAKHSLKRALL